MSYGWTRGWKNYLKDLEKECIHFGHNCWDDSADTRRRFAKLEKMGAEVLIEIVDKGSSPYCIRVMMPSNFFGVKGFYAVVDAIEKDGEVAMYILTKMPPASKAVLKNRTKQNGKVTYLDMEWHW